MSKHIKHCYKGWSTLWSLLHFFHICPITETRYATVKKLYITEKILFMNAIAMTPSPHAASVDVLFDNFNFKINTIPVKIRKTTSKRKAPWRNAIVWQWIKRKCRKAECMVKIKARKPLYHPPRTSDYQTLNFLAAHILVNLYPDVNTFFIFSKIK